MTDQQPSLRFDHREIAVIFSLFVFVSLLMFTVGILVGKGLAQAKYEAMLMTDRPLASSAAPAIPPPAPPANAGSSITSDPPPTARVESVTGAPTAEKAAPGDGTAPADTERRPAEAKKTEALQLVPARPQNADAYAGSLKEPTKDAQPDVIMKNPKIRSLLEDGEPGTKRGTSSLPKLSGSKSPPKSFAQGKFTVQVGSYPTEKDAAERVETLKKLGFPYAYFSAKELGEKKDTWYRVWLGYYPDFDGAQHAGQLLQERGEVKNYLVRKTDTTL